MIRDNIPPFQMIGKEYFKIDPNKRLCRGIDIMIIRTCTGGILHPIILHKGKILNNLNILYPSILTHQLRYCILANIIQPTYKQLPH